MMIVKMSNMFLSVMNSVSDPCVVKNDFDLFLQLMHSGNDGVGKKLGCDIRHC